MGCEFSRKNCRCTQIENISSFYESIKFETILPNAKFQAGKFVNFGSELFRPLLATVPTHFSVTFNRGKPLPNLLFVPTKCEVMNKENNSQIWQIWDSGYGEDEMGTCDKSPSPVGFKMIRSPNNQDSTSNAFYGMTYQGGFFFIFIVLFQPLL